MRREPSSFIERMNGSITAVPRNALISRAAGSFWGMAVPNTHRVLAIRSTREARRSPMKAMILAVLGLAIVTTTTLLADDAEDVRQATLKHFDALNKGDIAAHIAGHAPVRSVFNLDSGPLKEYTTLDAQAEVLRVRFEAGYKSQQEIRDIKVGLYGNVAIVTGHVVGSVIDHGATMPVNERRTAVLVKQADGRWLEVHQHSSPLVEGHGEGK
jgi:ketosteroid isomerase-like protein